MVTDFFDGSYQQAILRGFLHAGKESDVSIVCFIGDAPSGAPNRSSWLLKHPLFALIGSESVDGLLVPASVTTNAGLEHIEGFLAQLGTGPRCYLGLERQGGSNIITDNDSGMAGVVEHLVRKHGHRRIAFIRGPDGNEEADRRYAVYQRVLRENDIEIDPALVFPGTFNAVDGRRAAEQIFEGSKRDALKVEAVVAANDDMALGFVSYLDAHRIRCPDTIVVTGFDDVYEARLARAPLTTVRQPIYEQGREAAKLLLAQARGEAPAKSVMKTELVVRRSCGCFASQGRLQAQATTSIGRAFQFDAALVEQRQRIQVELLRAGHGRLAVLGAGWEGRLLTAFVSEVKGDSQDGFRHLVDDLLLKLIDARIEPTVFHELISVLWERLLPCTVNSPEIRLALESLLDGARLAICSAGQRALGADRAHSLEYALRVIQLAGAIAASADLAEVAAVLDRDLGWFKIDHLDVALFNSGVGSHTLKHCLACVKGKSSLMNAAVDHRNFVRHCLRGRSRAGIYLTGFGSRDRFTGVLALDIDEHNSSLLVALREAFAVAAVHGMFD